SRMRFAALTLWILGYLSVGLGFWVTTIATVLVLTRMLVIATKKALNYFYLLMRRYISFNISSFPIGLRMNRLLSNALYSFIRNSL
ncbi:MAG: hypothetical protein ACRD47_08860, partial [Nitrososphaeraceae archaeon]